MRVVLAPNAFKGTFDAVEVADAWVEALAGRPGLETDPRPTGDGGDGFVPLVRRYRPDVLAVSVFAPDPVGRRIAARWGWDSEAAEGIVESAAVVGLARLAPGERDPLRTTTDGLGVVLRAAARMGVERIALGLGGSATVDGGLGMARRLGFRFEGAGGDEVRHPAGLPRLARIVPPDEPPLPGIAITALADVDHPLLGARGAAATFAPQKGADEAAVARLEEGLARLAERWVADLGAPPDLPEREGAGAAGGLGAGCAAFLGARTESGSSWCAELAGLAAAIGEADAVVTGEGVWDAQSTAGKGTGWVVARARSLDVPVVVACGRVAGDPPPAVLVVDGKAIGKGGARLDRGDLGALARRAIEVLERVRA